jgi:transposase InsO family protein
MRLRLERNLGSKRIQAELLQRADRGGGRRFRLSTATIWKVLRTHDAPPLRKVKTPQSPKRYSRPVPGDRVQIDTMKVAPGLYQFTAIDDCTRVRFLGLYKRRKAANAVRFLEERILEEFHFPIQRVQTDRGAEFFGRSFQEALHRHHIKFRPTPPRLPHLNGKVERSQLTDKQEFWALQDLSGKPGGRIEHLVDALGCWQTFYNWVRPHGALNGRTPRQHASERSDVTPWRQEVWDAYDEKHEFMFGGRDRDYTFDQRLQEWKRSL